MTYNVSGGTLNRALSIYPILSSSEKLVHQLNDKCMGCCWVG